MILPDRVFVIIQALHARNPGLALGDDEARRTLQKQIVETVAARHPGEGWGWKRADPGRPPSKDAIANNQLMPGHIIAWDCFDGATRTPVQRDSMLIDDQVFMAVPGVDHLGPGPLPQIPTAQPRPQPLQVNRQEFLDALVWLDGVYRQQMGRAGGIDLEGIAAHVFDTYLGERMKGASVADAKGKVVRQINAILGRSDIHV